MLMSNKAKNAVKLKNSLTKLLNIVLVGVFLLSGSLLGLQYFGVIDVNNFIHKKIEAVPYSVKNPNASVVETLGDSNIYAKDDDTINTIERSDGSESLYAPMPDNEFKNETCDLTPLHEITELPKNSWYIPAIDKSATFNYSGFHNSPVVIPDAPNGTQYASGSIIGETKGSILNFGHVNYTANTVEGKTPFDKSPYGYFSELNPCDRIYMSDDNGEVWEFAVVSKYLVAREDFKLESDLFRTTGDLRNNFSTCAGEFIGANDLSEDTTNPLDGYTHNLITSSVPVNPS